MRARLSITETLYRTIWMVSRHWRLFLLGPSATDGAGRLLWNRRHTSFLVRVIVLSAGPIFATLGVFHLSPLLGFLAYPATYYIAARLSFVLPATAIDVPMSWRDSWDLSGDHQIFVLAVVIGVPALSSGLAGLLMRIPHVFIPLQFLMSIATIVVIGCLSLAYQALVDRTDESPEAA